MQKLLNNVTVNGPGTAIQIQTGASFNVQCGGNFGGGSVQIQLSIDGTSWAPVKYNGSPLNISDYTAYNLVWVGGSQYIRAVLSGATSPSLTCELLL